MDKMIATFVGRPPLMNSKFCTPTAPLDLSDADLVAGGDVLNKAISELDSAGWNTKGMQYLVTPTRLRYQLAIIREEALEVVLGTHEQHNLIQKSEYVISPNFDFSVYADQTSSKGISKQNLAPYGEQLRIIFDMIGGWTINSMMDGLPLPISIWITSILAFCFTEQSVSTPIPAKPTSVTYLVGF
jgi:hypothetical protein